MDTHIALVPLLRAQPIFASLSERSIAEFVGKARRLSITAGATLVRQGDASESAFILLEGEADVFVETSYGPVMLAPLTAGQLFGEIGAFSGIVRTATVRARTAALVLQIECDLLLALGRSNPDILLSAIRQLGQRIATINRAVGFYTQALAALERDDFDPSILDELLNPMPELLNFAQTFRRMAEQIILRRAQRQEMASASAIQRAMLPPPAAPLDGDDRIDIHAMLRPAREVGGDLYNFFVVDADRIALVIGDVSGKGVPASLFMAMTQTVMRLALREIDDLAIAVSRANELLSADNQEAMFATLFCGVLDLRSGLLTYCNCGHNPPLVLRTSGACDPLLRCGPALAMLPTARYPTRSVVLAPGDRLLLYTDGITEASDALQMQFGDDRLDAVCRSIPSGSARDLVEMLLRQVDEFVAEAPQFDDIACLAVRYHGANAVPQR